VSAAGAHANLMAEMPTFDFDGERASTQAAWQTLVDKIEIGGADKDHAHAFFASMYHLFLMPTEITDVDGSYMGFDHVVRSADHFVSDMSLWDTYRTLHPLYALIAPEDATTAVQSLSWMAEQNGAFPKWPLLTGETGTMLGASAEVVLADAYAKGVRDFDAESAYQTLFAAATSPDTPPGGRGGREDVVPYMDYGYVPSDNSGSVSRTTEYAYDDFALGNLADALGHTDDAAMLHARAKSYQKLFDPGTGFLRARSRSGELDGSAFDPTAFTDEYVESNGWQSTWYAAHDIDGLVGLYGGRDAFISKLEMFFDQAKTDWDALSPTDTLKKAAQRPYYWGGNEPDIQAPYMFAQAGRPELTQKWVRWSMDTLYGPGNDGLPGNDDGGTMSAWYVFSAMGLYPIAGSDRYIVGAPRFPHMVVYVAGGALTIDAPDVSDANLYVQSVTLNGSPLSTPELKHSDLAAGGNLTFTMGPSPSSWGQ
jgi:predicted alpha-1,2-mannosidase